MSTGDEVRFEVRGVLGVITLDRPKALNALTREMVDAMSAQLRDWRLDPKVAAVLVEAVPGRAFCAGGDVRAVVEAAATTGAESAMPFFRDEYRLNWRIKSLGKPYISLLDGVTMGGGVGISVHGTHRVVTESTLFAMPETGIGFFPDVGGSYFLPRCPGAIGMYLGLSGARLRAAECLTAGIGTHHVAAARLPELLERLADAPATGLATALEETLRDMASAPAEPCTLRGRRSPIDELFRASDPAALVRGLEQDEREWAREQGRLLRRHSPLAVCLTFAQIVRGAELDFAGCMRLEYAMVRHMLEHGEFAEGVRALLIDKDKQPRWRHRAIEDVTMAEIASIMAPVTGPELPLDWQGV